MKNLITRGGPLAFVMTWMLAFCAFATFMVVTDDIPQVFRLRNQHAETLGKVVRFVPQSHGAIEVKYEVDGTPYQSTFGQYVQTHPLKEGASVNVYYAPSDPANAVISPPSEILWQQLTFTYVASMLMSGVLVGAIFLRRRSKSSRPDSSVQGVHHF